MTIEEAAAKVKATLDWAERLRYADMENDSYAFERIESEQAAVRDLVLAAFDDGVQVALPVSDLCREESACIPCNQVRARRARLAARLSPERQVKLDNGGKDL